MNTQNNSKSQTTQILYREPTFAEMHPKTNALQNVVCFAIVFLIFCFIAITFLRGCADEQHRNGEKYRSLNAEVSK
ncbi:hypothetical protein G9F31_01000 [Acinetobacter sp. 187]|uniref:hypothetical protein n=1 Tax=Acinetobacter lanii TaxID=2715163 RepID=UPI00140A0BB7|nr:hypothetical protein [Acinetobacter lanii]NHC02362.1 hypothetical protein [Acinetobacter lanii]